MFVQCPQTKLLLKFCPDILIPKENIIIDVKTASGYEDWGRQVMKYNYHIQAAFYLYCLECMASVGLEYDKFTFIVFEKSPPYKIRIKQIGKGPLLEARKIIIETLHRIKESYETKSFESLVDEDVDIFE